MKRLKKPYRMLLLTTCIILYRCNSSDQEIRTFYKVPLVCTNNKGIASGSRVKPLFLDTEKLPDIKESWINREGTVIAIVWNKGISAEEKSSVIMPLFRKHGIEAELITDVSQKKGITESFFSNHAPAQKKKDKWYKGIEADQLSMEEAASLGDSSTLFALKAELINEQEALQIKNEITEYMKTELTKVRTVKDLTSDETDLKWKKYGYDIYVKYIGSERAERVRNHYIDYQKKILKKGLNKGNP